MTLSTTPTRPLHAPLHSASDRLCGLLVHRWHALIVAARWLVALVRRYLSAQRTEELAVDVAGPGAVWADKDDNRLIDRRPDGEHAVGAVEVTTADVIDVRPSETVARSLAAPVLDLTDDAECGVSPATSQPSDLMVSEVGQRDVDRRLAPFLRSSPISVSRS